MNNIRPFFASMCLMAVTIGQEFNLEHTLMERAPVKNGKVIPNWMRGFYDEDFLEQKRK